MIEGKRKEETNVSQVRRMSPLRIYKLGLSISGGFGFWGTLKRSWPEGRISAETLVELWVDVMREAGLSDAEIILYGDFRPGRDYLDMLGEIEDYFIIPEEARKLMKVFVPENEIYQINVMEESLKCYDEKTLTRVGLDVIDVERLMRAGNIVVADEAEYQTLNVKIKRSRKSILMVSDYEYRGFLIKNRGVLGKKLIGTCLECDGRIYGNDTQQVCSGCGVTSDEMGQVIWWKPVAITEEKVPGKSTPPKVDLTKWR